MSKLTGDDRPADSASAILADLVDGLATRIQAGERIDWQEVARRHPEHVIELRWLCRYLENLQELSESGVPLALEGAKGGRRGRGNGRPDLPEGRPRPAHRTPLLRRLLGWLRRPLGGAPVLVAALALAALCLRKNP